LIKPNQGLNKTDRGAAAVSQYAIKVPKLLPTLGMCKYTERDLDVNTVNPYSTNVHTEQLLIHREREREFDNFHRLEANTIKIQNKKKGSNPGRSGIFRNIKDIPENQANI
jgi:hypothetical protein